MDEITFFEMDWRSLLVPKLPLGDVIIRCILIFSVMQVGMRLLGRKNMSYKSGYNTATLFLMGTFAGRAVLGEDNSVTSCVLGLATVLVLNGVMTWGLYRSRRFATWIEGPLVQPLMRDGIVLVHSLRAARCPEEVLLAQLRSKGVADLAQVKDAYLERTGEITFIMR